MTIYDTCKYWESKGQKGVYEKTFEYSFRKIKHQLKMLKKIWYIECVISDKRKLKEYESDTHLPF